jgi:hypothetical protein
LPTQSCSTQSCSTQSFVRGVQCNTMYNTIALLLLHSGECESAEGTSGSALARVQLISVLLRVQSFYVFICLLDGDAKKVSQLVVTANGGMRQLSLLEPPAVQVFWPPFLTHSLGKFHLPVSDYCTCDRVVIWDANIQWSPNFLTGTDCTAGIYICMNG